MFSHYLTRGPEWLTANISEPQVFHLQQQYHQAQSS